MTCTDWGSDEQPLMYTCPWCTLCNWFFKSSPGACVLLCWAGTPRVTQGVPVRTAAVEAFIHEDYDADRALAVLKQQLKGTTFSRCRAPKVFIKAQYQKFKTRGSVLDNYGRKRKTPGPGTVDELALRAAKILKSGYQSTQEIPAEKKNQPPRVVPVHTFWGTMKEAVERSVGLKELLEAAGITAKALLRRMEKADPSLVRRTLWYKLHHTPGTIADRMRVSHSNLERAAAEPDFLRRVVWIDEATIWLVNNRHCKRRVWCDAHDWDTHRVVKCPMMAKGKPVKVHIMCAVNYELGPFFIEFTTGTHGIRRLHIEEKVYRVSGTRQV